MSHAATFELSEELAAQFAKESSGDGTLACILVSIHDEVFTLSATVPLGASAEADFEATKRLLSEDEATYLLFRLLRGGESQDWAFISFVPDTAPVKQKMLYANAKDTLKKKLPGGDVFGQETHFSDFQDVALDSAVAGDHAAAMKHIMTDAEQMVMHGGLNSMHMPRTCHAHAMHMPCTTGATRRPQLGVRGCRWQGASTRPAPPRPAHRSSALAIAGPRIKLKPEPKPKPGQVKSAGLTFPLEAAAAAKVGEFSQGGTHLVVLEIVNEQVVLKGSGSAAAASDVQAALPSSEPSYCLFRWGTDAKVLFAAPLPSAACAHVHQDCSPGRRQDPLSYPAAVPSVHTPCTMHHAPCTRHARAMHAPCACQVLFVFCCPDDAPVRGKMLHASSKSSMLEGLQQAFGVVVEKSIEINEPADLTEAWLSAEVYGQAPSASGASATLTAKAAPRGGRRLIRKPKEPSAAEE